MICKNISYNHITFTYFSHVFNVDFYFVNCYTYSIDLYLKLQCISGGDGLEENIKYFIFLCNTCYGGWCFL